MAKLAGVECSPDQIRGTIRLLDYYRRFLRSDCGEAKDPKGSYGTITKAMAQRDLAKTIHVAINRKAGIPDVACRKQESIYQNELYRDFDELRAHRIYRRRLWGLNGRRFRTDDIQARFGHMLQDDD